MPDKLTGNEIVKALRSWLEEIRKSRQAYLEKVNEEHYPSMRYEYLLSDTIHEINRLQAENETLRGVVKQNHLIRNNGKSPLSLIKAEAYKEFAERLKEEKTGDQLRYGYQQHFIPIFEVDNLLKEMEGEK